HRRRDAGQRIEREPDPRRRHVGDEDDGVIQTSPSRRCHLTTMLRARSSDPKTRAYPVYVFFGPSVYSASMTSSLPPPPEAGGASAPSGAAPSAPGVPPALLYSVSAILCDAFCSRSNAPSKSAASFGSRLFSTVSLASFSAPS